MNIFYLELMSELDKKKIEKLSFEYYTLVSNSKISIVKDWSHLV